MSNWHMGALGDVAEVFNGKTPSKSEQRQIGHPVLKIRDVSELGGFRGNFDSYVDATFADRYAGKKIALGDTLILNAAHNAAYVGSKTFRAVPETVGALATGEWLLVRPDQALLDAAFAHHWVTSPVAKKRISDMVNGIHLYPKDVARLKVPLPSLPEQRRIAAILDQADALRAKRREALTQLDSLTQSIFIEMFGSPTSNSKKWPTLPLTEACHCYSGGTPSKANPAYWQGSTPWFSAKDLKRNDLFDSADHIAPEVTEQTTLRLLPADTVTIVVRGMILAHTFPVSVLRVPATINQDLKALLPRAPLRSQFLAACLRAQSAAVLALVSEAGHGTKRLDTESLGSVQVLLPGKELQDKFEERVAKVEQLRIRLSAAVVQVDSLFASLQHRAFHGEL